MPPASMAEFQPSTLPAPPSLVPQRLDRIELRRASCRNVTKDDADGGGEGEGEQVDAGAEQEGQRQQVGQAVAGDEGEQ